MTDLDNHDEDAISAPLGVRVIDGLTVRVVDRLPDPTVRDRVAWTVDSLTGS